MDLLATLLIEVVKFNSLEVTDIEINKILDFLGHKVNSREKEDTWKFIEDQLTSIKSSIAKIDEL